MKVVRRIADLHFAISQNKQATVGFVPTMGALHRGHISLVERCRAECGTVVVSIFVNPTQFNDPGDLASYPRTLEADLAMLEKAGADIVFTPDAAEIYPEPDTRVFDFGTLEKVMEGAHRPGHFNGVAQVVSRLFDIVEPAKAYFGEKDFQQLAVIRSLVAQTGQKVEITGCPIIRETDGLAMSSRNTLLTAAQRTAAPHIYRMLRETAQHAGRISISEFKRRVTQAIDSNPELKTEYFEIADCVSLQPAADWNDSADIRAFVAVRVGNVRLIDNLKL